MTDWEIGDLALCVEDPGPCCCGYDFPAKVDRVYRVQDISPATPMDIFVSGGQCGPVFLKMEGIADAPDHEFFLPCVCFRKLEPPQPEPASEEFAAKIRDLTRVPEVV